MKDSSSYNDLIFKCGWLYVGHDFQFISFGWVIDGWLSLCFRSSRLYLRFPTSFWSSTVASTCPYISWPPERDLAATIKGNLLSRFRNEIFHSTNLEVTAHHLILWRLFREQGPVPLFRLFVINRDLRLRKFWDKNSLPDSLQSTFKT